MHFRVGQTLSIGRLESSHSLSLARRILVDRHGLPSHSSERGAAKQIRFRMHAMSSKIRSYAPRLPCTSSPCIPRCASTTPSPRSSPVTSDTGLPPSGGICVETRAQNNRFPPCLVEKEGSRTKEERERARARSVRPIPPSVDAALVLVTGHKKRAGAFPVTFPLCLHKHASRPIPFLPVWPRAITTW